MSEVAGLMVLVSNYETASIIENENEIEVTTVAVVQPTEAIKLAELGWVRRAENKFVFIKTQDDTVKYEFSAEVDNLQEKEINLEEAFEAGVDDVIKE